MCGHYFFLFHINKKIYTYIKVSFVDPTIIINKNKISFKKKRKKNDLEKEKRSDGVRTPSAQIVCINSPTSYPLGHVVPDYIKWQNKRMILDLLKPSLIGDDRK